MDMEKVYVVVLLYEACAYGDAYAEVEVFKNKEDAKKYADKMKSFAVCHIEQKEIS